jgi:hypothetical protein
VNRDAIGARATLHSSGSEGTTAFREVKSGLSYLSQGGFDLHFGLGDGSSSRTLEIRWPGGDTETVLDPEPGFLLLLEGAGRIPRANIGLP